MKKSKRYGSRYTAKKRHVENLDNLLVSSRVEIAYWRKRYEESREQLVKVESSKDHGVTTIKIGTGVPGFRGGKLLGINLVIDVEQFFYAARFTQGNVLDISHAVDHHCREVAHKLREAMLEYAQKEMR